MDLFVGQRVALGPRTGAIIDIRSPGLVTVAFDSGGFEDVDPNALHYAHDDYPELGEAIWEHPSPEKALNGDPYLHLRSLYRRSAVHVADSPYEGDHDFHFYYSHPGASSEGHDHTGHEHVLQAYPRGTGERGGTPPEGEIHWDNGSGEIKWLKVNEPSQRQGLGTELYQRAHEEARINGVVRPKHSWDQTDNGRSWAKSLHTADGLSPAVTGDSGQMHTDNQALPGPVLSIDFIPLEPGVLCSFCGVNPAQCTVNQATLCLECAEHRWGIPVQEAMAEAGPGQSLGQPSVDPQEGQGLPPEADDTLGHTAGVMDWLMGKVAPHLQGGKLNHNWCRFRRDDICWKSGVMDPTGTQAMGYAVWAPRNMGPCGRATVAAQRACGHTQPGPGSEPGPKSNDPQAMTDATVSFAQGGQRGATPGASFRYASMEHEANGPYEGGYRFEFRKAGVPSGGRSFLDRGNYEDCHRVHAFPEGSRKGSKPIGHLIWDPANNGEIKSIGVNRAHRHNGVATELFRRANEIAASAGLNEFSGKPRVVPPQHSRTRSGQGDAWAKSLGGPVPDRAGRPRPHEEDMAAEDPWDDGSRGWRRDQPGHQASNTDHFRSAMVSLDLPDGLLDSTEQPCHCTVVYLGKGLDGPRIDEIGSRLQQLAAGTPGPLTGTVGGLGTFPPSESSDWKTPVYAIPHIEGIDQLRSHLEDLNASQHKDFHPHVTLRYLDEGEPMPPEPSPVPVSFTHLTLHNGDDVRHYPFAGKFGHLARFEGNKYYPPEGGLQDGDTHPGGAKVRGVGGYRNVQWVPTHEVRQYAHQPLRPGNLEPVKAYVKQHGMDPLIMHYNKVKGTAELGEGNHRLRVAEDLGWSHVPVRVLRAHNDMDETWAKNQASPRTYPAEHGDGYVKADLAPSEIGLSGIGRDQVMPHEARYITMDEAQVHEATWRDVMDKAKRLRETNAVHLLETPTPESPYVFAEVKGDTATHHCFVSVKGEEQGQWSCSCPWGDYGPNGPLAAERKIERYKKTPCSHVLATRWELQARTMFGRNPYTGALHIAMNAEDEIPPRLGQSPIPPGKVRLYHETWMRHVPDIRANGLKREHAHGDSNEGWGSGDPSAGIWACTKHPNGDYKSEGPNPEGSRATIEFWAHPEQLSHELSAPRPDQDPEEWGESRHHTVIIKNSDIEPHQITAIHEPWHTAYHQMKEHGDPEAIKRGDYDGDWQPPAITRALEKIKKEGSLHMAVNGPDEVPAEMGTTPIPKDHVRFYHYTDAKNTESIRQHGILNSHTSPHSSTPNGIWASTGRPNSSPGGGKSVVEFHLPHADVNHFSRGSTAEDYGPDSHQDVPLGARDIHPHEIVAIHEGWHDHYRYMSGHPDVRAATKAGEHDSLAKMDPEYSRAIDKIKREGAVDPLVDWFAGRFLMEAKAAPSQYTPIHPGYDQKSKVINQRATHFEDLSQPMKDEVTKRTEDAVHEEPHTSHNGPEGDIEHSGPLTHEMMVHHIMDMHGIAHTQPGVVKNGRKWYKDAHNQAKTWSKAYGMTHRQGCGIMAALSPGKHWDSNLAMAHYHMKHLSLKTNEDGTQSHHTFDMSPEHVESLSRVKPRATKDNPDPRSAHEEVTQEMAKHGLTHGMSFGADSMSDSQAHWALKLQAKHTHNIRCGFGGDMVEKPDSEPTWQSEKEGTKAVRIARGEQDPDQALGGHKVRSFFNNILAPGKTDDVTIDSHAASVAVHGKMSSSSKTLDRVLEGPERSGINSKLGYAHVASAYREAHRRLQARDPKGKLPGMDAKSTPADLQAITWKAWRNLNEGGAYGGAKPKGGFTAAGYPVLSSMSFMGNAAEEDDDDSSGGLLDPFGGPDEPDPDLHRTRTIYDDPDDLDTWGARDDDEDDDGQTKVGSMYDWTEMLRQARREHLSQNVLAHYQPPQPQAQPLVPLGLLSQVPHHLATGFDEFGFDASTHYGGAVPSDQWQQSHSTGADNPGDTAPAGFGEPLDPMTRSDIMGVGQPDKRLLEPGGGAAGGGAISNPISGQEQWWNSNDVVASYHQQPPSRSQPQQARPAPQPAIPPGMSPGEAQVLAEHQAGLDYLRPPAGGSPGLPGAPGASVGMSREAVLAQDAADKAQFATAADMFLQTGTIAAPGLAINMDNFFTLPRDVIQREAKSRDFTPDEQDEMIREGELEGVRASNYHMLRTEGTMYEELERQLSTGEQSEAAANALWW